jgi:hypothetical protein
MYSVVVVNLEAIGLVTGSTYRLVFFNRAICRYVQSGDDTVFHGLGMHAVKKYVCILFLNVKVILSRDQY